MTLARIVCGVCLPISGLCYGKRCSRVAAIYNLYSCCHYIGYKSLSQKTQELITYEDGALRMYIYGTYHPLSIAGHETTTHKMI